MKFQRNVYFYEQDLKSGNIHHMIMGSLNDGDCYQIYFNITDCPCYGATYPTFIEAHKALKRLRKGTKLTCARPENITPNIAREIEEYC